MIYYTQNNIGSTTLLTNKDGSDIGQFHYTPFGEMWVEEASAVDISHITRFFTNQQYDKESGLYYYNARYYDPHLGSFITPDPAMASLNHYAYCSANPIKYSDPTGLTEKKDDTTTTTTTTTTDDDDRSIFDDWHEKWIEIESKAIDKEKEERNKEWKKDPVEFAEKMDKFKAGDKNALGKDYKNAAELLGYVQTVLKYRDDVLNWIENQVTAGRNPSFDDINKYAFDSSKAHTTYNTVAMSVIIIGMVSMANIKASNNTNKGINKNPDIKEPYKRPNNATTQQQRQFVQNKPCVDCGITVNKMIADHKNPLVVEYYETGSIDLVKMRSLDAIQPQCPGCSSIQGGILSNFSKAMKEFFNL